MTIREFVHKVKYDGKDCISGSLRTIIGPEFHSSFCDDACEDAWNILVEAVQENQRSLTT